MKTKFFKYAAIGFGVALITIGSWKTAEYLLGIKHLKYATYQKNTFSTEPIASDDVE